MVIGTGPQAVSQVEAIQCVRNLKSIKVIGRTIDQAEEFCKQFDSFVEPGNNDCLVDADIICTTLQVRATAMTTMTNLGCMESSREC